MVGGTSGDDIDQDNMQLKNTKDQGFDNSAIMHAQRTSSSD